MRKRITIFVAAVTLYGALSAGAVWWYVDLQSRGAGAQLADDGLPVDAGVEIGDDGRPAKMPWLVGLSLKEVIANLGEPIRRLEYTMEDSPGGEFRIELYNTYPPNNRAAMKAKILELQWDRPGYHMCVWLHEVNGEWKALDTCRWPEGTAF
jgi:hypothetical protein